MRILFASAGFETRRLVRSWRYLLFAIGFPIAFYVMYTAAQGRTSGPSQSGVEWPAFFMVSMAAFAALGAGLSVAPLIAADRSGGWIHQLRVMPCPSLVFLLAKTATTVLTLVPAVVLVMLGAVLVAGVRLPMEMWLELLAVTVVGALPLVALGILLGYLLDERSATGGVLVVYIGLAIMGGLWMPPSLFSGGLLMLTISLPSYHLARLGWDVLGGSGIELGSVLVLLGYGVLATLALAGRYRAELAASPTPS